MGGKKITFPTFYFNNTPSDATVMANNLAYFRLKMNQADVGAGPDGTVTPPIMYARETGGFPDGSVGISIPTPEQLSIKLSEVAKKALETGGM